MDIVIFNMTVDENEKLRKFLIEQVETRPSTANALLDPVKEGLRSVIFEIQPGHYTKIFNKYKQTEAEILRRQVAINHA